MKKYMVLGASVIALSLVAAGPVRAGGYDWSGSYLGLKVGGGFGGDASQTSAMGGSGDYDIDGVLVGIMSGYNFQADNIVFGIDSDSSFSGIDGKTNNGFCVTTCKTEIDYLGTTRGRLGFAMDRFLPYVTGGLASALVDGRVNGANGNSKFHFGYAVGGGLEWAFAEGWTARAEYLFIDLGSKKHKFGAGSARVKVDDMHVLRAGVSMNTDWIWDSIFGR